MSTICLKTILAYLLIYLKTILTYYDREIKDLVSSNIHT